MTVQPHYLIVWEEKKLDLTQGFLKILKKILLKKKNSK